MSQVIALDGEQTIYQARETQQLLATALHNSDGLVVDLSAVQEVDSTLIQTLLWLVQEGQRNQKMVELLTPSASLEQVIAMLGLQQQLPFGVAP